MAYVMLEPGVVVLPFANFDEASHTYELLCSWQSDELFRGIQLDPLMCQKINRSPMLVTGRGWTLLDGATMQSTDLRITYLLVPTAGMVTDRCFPLNRVGKINRLTVEQVHRCLVGGLNLKEVENQHRLREWSPHYLYRKGSLVRYH